MSIADLKREIAQILEWNDGQMEKVRLALVKNLRTDYPEDGMSQSLNHGSFSSQKDLA